MATHIEASIPIVMISSTVMDLAEHRKQALDACWRMEMFPKMMEHLPAADADAIEQSMQMVDQANIYVGIYAHRYGYVPADRDRSITEMEYERAVEKDIPRLIFLAADSGEVDAGENGADIDKLNAFKQRVKTERVVSFFEDPRDLRQKMVESLSHHRIIHPTVSHIHPVTTIAAPPAPYIAHAYTLLQTPDLIGRVKDIEALTDWITRPMDHKIFTLVAIGGMGKSALAWKWFNEIVPQHMPALVGRVWWSFYESDATFENFVTRTLAYVSQRSIDEIEQEPFPEREQALLQQLNQKSYVVVMDGLERLLIAYARTDAAHLQDEDVDDNRVDDPGLALVTGDSSQRKLQLRKTADTRAGQFLRKLAGVEASRILISTRLYPADLQMGNGDPLPGCYHYPLGGLSDEDALALWQAYGARGSLETMTPLFQRIDKHPLLIQVLASEVMRNRKDPGNFQSWREAQPDFDPFTIPLVQVKSHVLYFALKGVSMEALRTLQVMAAFRMPTSFDTLQSILVTGAKWAESAVDEEEDDQTYGSLLKFKRRYDEEEDNAPAHEKRFELFDEIQNLDDALTELEERGLLGWDRQSNRYDLHPIVRGVAWSGLETDIRNIIHERFKGYFESMPRFDRDTTKRVEGMTSAIELYNALMSLGHFGQAAELYSYQLGRLHSVDPNMAVEMLTQLFGEVSENIDVDDTEKGQLLRQLGIAYNNVGRPDLLTEVVGKALDMLVKDWDRVYPLCDISLGYCQTGQLFEAEVAARNALLAAREADPRWLQPVALMYLARCLRFMERYPETMLTINRSQKMFTRRGHTDYAALSRMLGMELLLWTGYDKEAEQVASMIWAEGERSDRVGHPFVLVPCKRLWGLAQAYLGDPTGAENKIHYSITQAHTDFRVDEELAAMLALAETKRLQSKPAQAIQLLEEAKAVAERGRYQLFLVDIHNQFARIATDTGDKAGLAAAATDAYHLSWCDGPPFSYYWGMYEAETHLRNCGKEAPVDLEPFDQEKLAHMPSAEINPEDEWHIDEKEYSSILISGFNDAPSNSEPN